jgi:predicted HicB family RNase H-like nuclease
METKNVLIELPLPLHKRAKVAAAESGEYLKDFIIDAIREKVERCHRTKD